MYKSILNCNKNKTLLYQYLISQNYFNIIDNFKMTGSPPPFPTKMRYRRSLAEKEHNETLAISLKQMSSPSLGKRLIMEVDCLYSCVSFSPVGLRLFCPCLAKSSPSKNYKGRGQPTESTWDLVLVIQCSTAFIRGTMFAHLTVWRLDWREAFLRVFTFYDLRVSKIGLLVDSICSCAVKFTSLFPNVWLPVMI